MKLHWLVSLTFSLLATWSAAFKVKTALESNIVPAPKSVNKTVGSLTLNGRIRLRATDAALRAFKTYVSESVNPGRGDAQVSLDLVQEHSHGDEGYKLIVNQDRVSLEARTEHGLFNGIMTLRQLLQSNDQVEGALTLPLVEIEDKPQFAWRGLMLDSSRHFFSPDDVKHLLQTMAYFKLNHFHWHLTDDQGWRFPVQKYPKLTTVGSLRSGTQKGHSHTSDHVPYKASYTVEEIRSVVDLADSLHIEIVPEFDMPGHSEAALAAYPELLSNGTNYSVQNMFGAFDGMMSTTDSSMQFQKDVIDELTRLFPNSHCIHIGGDEVKGDSSRQITSAAGHVHEMQRTPVVWDEVVQSGAELPKDSVVMIWRSWEGMDRLGNEAREFKGAKVVLAPQDRTYLDQWQTRNGQGEQFDAIGGFLPVDKVYNIGESAGSAQVLGMQAQLWSEYIAGGGKDLDYMAWPRGAALAEAAWSGSDRPGYDDFLERLGSHRRDLEGMSVNFHPFF